ncbi:MAG: hypothetical protein KDD64_03435 [Bdellovibrionales bacterium]|nr:hypothetical protein [Bdellovibrionales bacterium]
MSTRAAKRVVLFSGQVGANSTGFVRKVADEARKRTSDPIHVHSIGSRMNRILAELGHEIEPGTILNLDNDILELARHSALAEVIREVEETPGIHLVKTYLSFYWNGVLRSAHSLGQLRELAPELILDVIENGPLVQARIMRSHPKVKQTLRETLEWRADSSILAQVAASSVGSRCKSIVVTRGHNDRRVPNIARIIVDPNCKRCYPSFPMSWVQDMPDTLKEIDGFRDFLFEHMYVSDPADVDERKYAEQAIAALAAGNDSITIDVDGRPYEADAQELVDCLQMIDDQIKARDKAKVKQSHIIVALVPRTKQGMPAPSTGRDQELLYAEMLGKRVYVVYDENNEKAPGPFYTAQPYDVLPTLAAVKDALKRDGYLK